MKSLLNKEELLKAIEEAKNKQSKKPKIIKYKMQGTLTEEDLTLLKRVVIDFNKYAMQYLNFEKISEADSIFSKLMKLWKIFCEKNPDLTWLTINNYSWFYK